VTIDPAVPDSLKVGRIDAARVDDTTEDEIAAQRAADKALALQDAGKFARRVRKRLGLSQAEFSERIDVPLETIRNWEQGKRSPRGPARSLLRMIEVAPDVAFSILSKKH